MPIYNLHISLLLIMMLYNYYHLVSLILYFIHVGPSEDGLALRSHENLLVTTGTNQHEIVNNNGLSFVLYISRFRFSTRYIHETHV